jgi:hypothetical protein
MTDRGKVLKGIFGHIALFLVNFLVLYSIIQSIQLFYDPSLPFLDSLVLGYMLVHTLTLLSIQLGIQVLELIKIRMPTFLISYYFQFSDDEVIPIPLLDPTKSRLAVLILLLVISGGPIFYPIFTLYGFFLVYAKLVAIVLDPSTILFYFERFLFTYMPPILFIIVLGIILSIVIIEFKHV